MLLGKSVIGEKTAFGELEQELAFCEKDVCFILPFQLFPVFSTCHINADDFTCFSCLQVCIVCWMVYGSGTFDYAMRIVALQASSITLEVFTLS
jgi:hypothetical protein